MTPSPQSDTPTPPPLHGWKRLVLGRHPKRTLIRAAVVALVAYVLFKLILVPARISGISMEPTYHDGRVNLITRLAFCWSKPQRGDVVAVNVAIHTSPLSMLRVVYLKRIIGLPGETIEIRSGAVLINGQPLPEPWMRTSCSWEEPPVTLQTNEYFVIGDNRTMPQGMHEHGRAYVYQIAGKVLW